MDSSLVRRTLQNAVSGTAAGVAVCLVGHPFDTLKVRLQTQPVAAPIYRGMVDCFVKTLRWEGVGGLYKGVGSPIVGQMFFRAALFTSYYQIQRIIATSSFSSSGRLSHSQYFACGAFTGLVASLAESPIDLFKTKMQVEILRTRSGGQALYRHVFHAGWVIMRVHGLRGVYQGLPATWLRNIPAFSIYFGVYELARDSLTPTGSSVDQLALHHLFLSGGVAGFSYWFFTYPTDVIKSSLQSDHSDPGQRRFRGVVQCARSLYREEGGVGRFYRGFLPCLLRSVPANATMLLVLEQCRLLFS